MNQQAKKKRSFPYVGLILWVTVVLVVVILGYTVMDSVGVIGKMNTAGRNNMDIRLSENEMDVYRFHVAQNQYSYQYWYVSSGMMSDTSGGLISSMDITTYVHYMLNTTVNSNQFDELAYEYAEQYLAYCAGAKDPKVNLYDTYKAEIQADIDEYMDGLQKTADAFGMSLGSYLKSYVGSGVSKKDVRNAMEYYYIAGKYAEKLTDDFSAQVKDDLETLEKYTLDNKANFYTSTYTAYKLVNGEKMKDKMKDCKTIDEVRTVIVDYCMDQKFENKYADYVAESSDLKDKEIPSKDQTKADVRATLLALLKVPGYEEVFKSDETDAYKMAAYKVVTSIKTSVDTENKKFTNTTTGELIESTAAWVDITGETANDLQKWLFQEGRKPGDTNLIETKTTSKDKDGKETTTYSYTWYIAGEDLMVKDNERTKNAYYVKLTDDGDDVKDGLNAEKKAAAFLEALKKENTPEKFAELVKKYVSETSTAGELRENLSYKSMTKASGTTPSETKELAEWLYAEGRKEGDVSGIFLVKNTKGEVTGCYIALYESENEETWEVNATQAIAGEKITEWYKEAITKYEVTIDYSHEGHAHEETTAEETTAATK